MSKTTLHALPGAFSLPSCSPQCIAAEAALRFKRVDYAVEERRPTMPLEWIQGHSTSSSSASTRSSSSPTTTQGGAPATQPCHNTLVHVHTSSTDSQASSLKELLQILQGSNLGLDSGLTDEERMKGSMIISAMEGKIFSLLWFCLFSDDASFNYLRARMPSTGGFFAPSVATQRQTVKNALYYATGCTEDRADLLAALADNFHSLEVQLKEQNAAKKKPQNASKEKSSSAAMEKKGEGGPEELDVPSFFLGGSNPTACDCYVFAASTFVIHGDFASNKLLLEVQTKIKAECPRLVSYTEQVRTLFFEDYAGYYKLRAASSIHGNTTSPGTSSSPSVDKEDPLVAADKLYASGRLTTVLATVAFASVYFVIANAEGILQILGAMEEVLDDGGNDGVQNGGSEEVVAEEEGGEQQPAA